MEQIIQMEQERQNSCIELIASENFVSEAVKSAVGSCLTNKYAEGYPEQSSIDCFREQHKDYSHSGRVGRYYGGCSAVDMVELEARYWMQKAFCTDYHVNVQPHSGSQANAAALAAVLQPGDTILSMSLDNGGHLTHGSPVNFSGKLYNCVHYGLTPKGYIDYDDLVEKAYKYKPKMILAGASSYSREILFDFIGTVAKYVGAYFMVDMAHIAGLVISGDHQSPFGVADIVTTTTHKTFRGPRGGVIFCTRDLASKIDGSVFPGTQGGPLMHVIAGKAVAAKEACSPEFSEYIHQVVKNSKAMSAEFTRLGYDVVTGGTDNHMFLVDFSKTHPRVTGKQVQDALEEYNITLNKNCVPGEKRSTKETSGVRIGTAAMTTKGWTVSDFVQCADKIDAIINRI